MPRVCALHLVHFKDREELMLAQFEKSIALAAVHLFEIENILVKRHRLLDVVHLDGDMITSINLHAHNRSLTEKKPRARRFFGVGSVFLGPRRRGRARRIGRARSRRRAKYRCWRWCWCRW